MGKPLPQRIRQKSTNPKLEEFADHEIGGEKPEKVDVKRVGANIEARIQLTKVDSANQIKLELNNDSFKIVASPNLYKVSYFNETKLSIPEGTLLANRVAN